VLEYITSSSAPGNTVPTQTQIDDFFEALETLLSTPFSISYGKCGNLEQNFVLVSGGNTLTLEPNEPIKVALMSAYHVRTNGYGYHSEAAVASDYYLLGVVESELTEDPECCGDKFANYMIGSLSVPEEGDVELYAVNTFASRLEDVSFDLS
jgi:hypothetical protein